jgi:hypothetical protein
MRDWRNEGPYVMARFIDPATDRILAQGFTRDPDGRAWHHADRIGGDVVCEVLGGPAWLPIEVQPPFLVDPVAHRMFPARRDELMGWQIAEDAR